MLTIKDDDSLEDALPKMPLNATASNDDMLVNMGIDPITLTLPEGNLPEGSSSSFPAPSGKRPGPISRNNRAPSDVDQPTIDLTGDDNESDVNTSDVKIRNAPQPNAAQARLSHKRQRTTETPDSDSLNLPNDRVGTDRRDANELGPGDTEVGRVSKRSRINEPLPIASTSASTDSRPSIATDSTRHSKSLLGYFQRYNLAQAHSSPSIPSQSPSNVAVSEPIPTGSSASDQALPSLPSLFQNNNRQDFNKSLPVPMDGQKLTRSQRLFAGMTGIAPQSLSISNNDEFFLFMEMREEFGWATFNMSAANYVRATEEYSARLTAQNASKGQVSVYKKNPKALMEKLTTIEDQIMVRIASNDFTSKTAGNETFWRRHCFAVPLGKAVMEATANTSSARKTMICSRCKVIMYPGPTKSPQNHKRGFCSNGCPVTFKRFNKVKNEKPGNQNVSPPPYPQPAGIFSEGEQFHAIRFLQTVQDVYMRLVVPKRRGHYLKYSH
ncbi:hypothetical protein QCA50_018024 [Cerrena zonata]|uniref:Uncharacterized protein n=1 Tax=Cerrena zonata TaxID=2478898 RepID=A0AAW0FH81_9APHY